MTMTKERQLARLRARAQAKSEELTEIGFLLKGTLLQRFKRCSSPGCACQSDSSKRHGPYWQWTNKVKGKTVSRTVSEEEVSRYREWMQNSRRFEQIVDDLYDLSAQADAILRSMERPDRAGRKRTLQRAGGGA